MKTIFMFKLIAVLFWINTTPLYACPKKCCTGYYFIQDRNMLAGHVLKGSTYKNVTAENPRSCFCRCSKECRCVSFNFGSSSNYQNCQLNEENRNTKPQLLTAASEFDYYDLVIDYPLEVSAYRTQAENSSAGVCADYNDCCETSPCLNKGQCTPNCDKNGRRFICRCPFNFTGAVCQTRRASDCGEVWDQGWRQSGHYDILDQNENNLTVFCDLSSDPEFIWTLVESFSLENVGQFKYLPSFKPDFIAIHEENPNWSAYKMSHAHMQHVRMGSTHLRATCNYPTRDVYNADFLRTSFDYFDLLVEPGSKCQMFEQINIRGLSCTECTAGVLYGGKHGYTFHVDSQKSSSVIGCQFDGSSGALASEDNFGFYGVYNTAFSCTESSVSTTQIWFGRKK